MNERGRREAGGLVFFVSVLRIDGEGHEPGAWSCEIRFVLIKPHYMEQGSGIFALRHVF